ncbi:nucleoside-triphosphatase THEP1 isoform X2 [Diachasmimorpha longicaudata]
MADSGSAVRKILFTGPPGIGKTTLCRKIISMLIACDVKTTGFYTEEVRSKDRKRIGFDISTLDQIETRGILARIDSALNGKSPSKLRVGPYQVFIDDFQKIAIPALNSTSDVLVIDEIGKMELLSKSFHELVENLFFGKDDQLQRIIIATIPARDREPQRHSKFFDKFYDDRSCQVIEVNRGNREDLAKEIFHKIQDMLKIK